MSEMNGNKKQRTRPCVIVNRKVVRQRDHAADVVEFASDREAACVIERWTHLGIALAEWCLPPGAYPCPLCGCVDCAEYTEAINQMRRHFRGGAREALGPVLKYMGVLSAFGFPDDGIGSP
jgi:hypothetical protein